MSGERPDDHTEDELQVALSSLLDLIEALDGDGGTTGLREDVDRVG